MKLCLGLAAICIAGRDVARTALDDLIRNRMSHCLLKCFDHIQHGIAGTGTQIINPQPAVGFSILAKQFHSSHMAHRQVYHMDIVTHTGAVGGGIVAAKHTQLFQLADCHLRDIGNQIVGDTVGVFTDRPLLWAPTGLK